MPNYEDEDYFIPLEDQRVFGAGITKKRVPFVRSSDHELSTLTSAPSTPAGSGASIANAYLSIVMPKSTSSYTTAPSSTSLEPSSPTAPSPASADRSRSAPPPTASSTSTPTCEICNLPLASSEDDQQAHKQHESSLAHQVCITHSHPPSHLDRNRHGLRYLESYGWDPDSRLGLGATGREGIRDPVKGKLKSDTVGLGAVPPPAWISGRKKTKEKVQKLNAKQVRKGHFDARRKGEKLREMFHRDEEVLRYLGAG
ncbi:hypothetical protein BJX70DRAFT_365265 [Aspergillus crustosus]